MTRCDNEVVFYRVFCVGLLVIAFTFTVILTNVFIDIDGLLSKKERESSEGPSHVIDTYETTSEVPEYYGGGRKDYGNKAYRNKRSLDTPDFLLHIKNPKMKSILTHRLATLLEELDEEESTALKKYKDHAQDENDIYVRTDNAKAKEAKEAGDANETKNEEMLHMAMHNILLKGVVGHMDLNEVYKKVHTLVRSYKHTERAVKDDAVIAISPNEDNNEETTEPRAVQTTTPLNEENQFFEEIVKCKKLQQQITEGSTEKATTLAEKPNEVVRNRKRNNTSPKFFIKTLIDIQKNDKEFDQNSNENIKGIIRLIYNGKSIKIRSMDEDETTTVTKPTTLETTTTTTTTENSDVEIISDILKQNFEGRDIPKSYVNSVLIEYLSKYKKKNQITEQPIKYTEKRLKRNIKLHHMKETKRFKKPIKKKDDDELYVEIETHFDDKGMKGKKKKELIRQLIEKIQKAIHSNQEIIDQKKPVKDRGQELHIRKRTQSSLAHKNDTEPQFMSKNSKNMLSYNLNMYREQAPISKAAPVSNPLPRVSDENGQDWRKREVGPKFFSTSKSINSAELSQVDVDFSKVMKLSGIPQRLQVPLNTDANLSEENPNAYLDLGNLQFMIKDIEGSGFSIGLNQYVDHAPDPESIKLFTGIESLVNAYHQTYDKNNPDYARQGITVLKHEMKKRDIEINKLGDMKLNEGEDKHVVNKRSVDQGIKGADYHSNEYKIIFDDKFLPYDNYQEIYEHKQKKVSLPVLQMRKKSNTEAKENKDETTDLDSIFQQKLKPSEIFDLASFLDRKKRSHSVQKIMNLNTKIRLNRFINTKAMPKQKFFLKSKRNKRQIGKIRIIAKDMKGHSDSDENIYIVSDENMYADRAVVRRTDAPESQEDKAEDTADYDPQIFEEAKPKIFALEDKVRHNNLMSKYPHVFVEDAEDDFATPIPAGLGRVFVKPNNRKAAIETLNDQDGMMEERMPKVQDLVHALVPYPKANYKVTVKLLPKDDNDTSSGFKEVHTSINKTFNKNGVLYSSLVNVSEISKIESANSTDDGNPPSGFINALQTIGFPYQEMKSFEHRNNNNKNEIHFQVATTPVVDTKNEELTRMLQAQKESIDKHFNSLKDKIHKMTRTKTTEAPVEAKKDLMDILAPSHFDTLNADKDPMSDILCNHLKEKEKDTTTEPTTTTTTTTTTTLMTTTTAKPELVEALKMKLLSAISQNERLTSRILNKIDQNTDILQTFLTKITDKIQGIPELTKAIHKQIKEDNHEHEHELNVKAHPVFLRQPNNNTDVPFIYAYKPCRPSVKSEAPVASIVYSEGAHKAIHKNDVVHVNQPTDPKTDFDFETLIQKDNTRYFIDEDYFKSFASPNKPGEEGIKKDDQLKMIDKSPMVAQGLPGMPIPVVEHVHVQALKNNMNINPFRYKSNAPVAKQTFNMTKVM